MSHEPRLPCPSCGYDLVGIFREEDTATCPECGNDANLRAVQRELERRARWWHVPLAFLVGFAILVFISTVTRLSPSDFDAESIGFAIIMAAIAVVASFWWIDLTRIERIIFAAGALVTSLFDSLWMWPVLLPAWFVGFWTYDFLKRWRQISDRW